MNHNNSVYLALFFLISQCVLAQQMPIDFSVGNHNFTPFSGSGFSTVSNPDGGSDTVGQFFNDGSDLWQGFFVDLERPIDLDFQKTISLNFYAFDPNMHQVIIKLENGINDDVEVMVATNASGWTNNLIFDFSNATISDTTIGVNASGTYNRLTIFIDGGTTTPGTYLIDDIDDGSTPTSPHELDVIYNDLVWADEFDTAGTVNTSNWHHQTQVIIPGVGWANGEQQHYTDRLDNSFVDDSGFLNIVAKRETYTSESLTKNYTSARLNSKFAFTYGRIDVRAKLPSGQGTWPAIWTLGKNIGERGGFWTGTVAAVGWPVCGEIDIMEHGLDALNEVSSALHTPCCHGGSPNKGSTMLTDVANTFHVYSVNWSPDQITFLVDNVGFYTYNPTVKDSSTWPFTQDQYILLNVAMGGVAGAIDPSFSESSMLIDYVRVYQNTGLGTKDVAAQEFILYPNPATHSLTITSQTVIDGVEIYDLTGKIIKRENKIFSDLDISNLKSGLYLVNIFSGNRKMVKKMVKQ